MPAYPARRGRSPSRPDVGPESYREDLVLRNGQAVRLRSVRPADRDQFVRGIQKLSPASRRARFFVAKRRFSQPELKYLTEVDGWNHYAIGVVLLNADGTEGDGIAVARFVRDRGDPTCAEPALTVLDAWQGMGLGRILLDRLVAAARERGIERFRAEFLVGNEAILKLFEDLCPGLAVFRRDEVVTADIPLPDAAPHPCPGSETRILTTLLRMAAQKLIRSYGDTPLPHRRRSVERDHVQPE